MMKTSHISVMPYNSAAASFCVARQQTNKQKTKTQTPQVYIKQSQKTQVLSETTRNKNL